VVLFYKGELEFLVHVVANSRTNNKGSKKKKKKVISQTTCLNLMAKEI
jgi:hypothetical protein